MADAQSELARLTERRDRARAKVAELERAPREAAEAVKRASAELAELERRALAGEHVTSAARKQAEEALLKARLKAAEPWPERLDGARAHARGVELV